MRLPVPDILHFHSLPRTMDSACCWVQPVLVWVAAAGVACLAGVADARVDCPDCAAPTDCLGSAAPIDSPVPVDTGVVEDPA